MSAFINFCNREVFQAVEQQEISIIAWGNGPFLAQPEALRGIAVQGFWGDATTNSLEAVARKTLDLSLAGKGLYIPGGLNRILSILGKIIPRSLVAAVIYKRWKRAQSKWPSFAANYEQG